MIRDARHCGYQVTHPRCSEAEVKALFDAARHQEPSRKFLGILDEEMDQPRRGPAGVTQVGSRVTPLWTKSLISMVPAAGFEPATP